MNHFILTTRQNDNALIHHRFLQLLYITSLDSALEHVGWGRWTFIPGGSELAVLIFKIVVEMCIDWASLRVPEPLVVTSSGSASTGQSTEPPHTSDDNRIIVTAEATGSFCDFKPMPIPFEATISTPQQTVDTSTNESNDEEVIVDAKKCFTCLEDISSTDEARRAVKPGCDSYICREEANMCVGCFRKFLYMRMFPFSKGDSKDNFPSLDVKCHQCYQTMPHSLIQKHAEAEIFENYDRAVCRRFLGQENSILKCAFDDCDGAEWTDDPGCMKSQKFRCPTCNRDTCLDCHGPLQNHLDRPCPAGKHARNPLRMKLAETRSRFKLKTKNKCPKCPIRYEKIEGCDHIVCGSRLSGGDFPGRLHLEFVVAPSSGTDTDIKHCRWLRLPFLSSLQRTLGEEWSSLLLLLVLLETLSFTNETIMDDGSLSVDRNSIPMIIKIVNERYVP